MLNQEILESLDQINTDSSEKISSIPDFGNFIQRLNTYIAEHYPANKKITAEEWNALFLAAMQQGNLQENSFDLIWNKVFPLYRRTINNILDTMFSVINSAENHETRITANRTDIDALLTDAVRKSDNLTVDYLTQSELSVSDTGALVQVEHLKNITTLDTPRYRSNIIIPVEDNKARLFLPQEIITLRNLESWHQSLLGKALNYVVNFTDKPASLDPEQLQNYLNNKWLSIGGHVPITDQTTMVDPEIPLAYAWFVNENAWVIAKSSVGPATNNLYDKTGTLIEYGISGHVVGSNRKFHIMYEVNGEGTVNGLDTLDNTVQELGLNKSDATALTNGLGENSLQQNPNNIVLDKSTDTLLFQMLNRVPGYENNTTLEVGYAGEEAPNSFAGGYGGLILQECGHTEGVCNIVLGRRSHGEGTKNVITGTNAHAEGAFNYVTGWAAHADGAYNEALFEYTNVSGFYNKSGRTYQSVVGLYNYPSEDALFIVGCGNSSQRVNSFEVGYHWVKAPTFYSDLSTIAELVVGQKLSANAVEIKKASINKLGTDQLNAGYNNNIVDGVTYSNVIGTGNRLLAGRNHTVSGANNTVKGNFNNVFAQSSSCEGENCLISGFVNNGNEFDYLCITGERNTASANHQHISGRYNALNEEALLIVGNGTGVTTEQRSNAFVVLEDGQCIAGRPTISEMDPNTLTTKGYVDAVLQQTLEDVEKALTTLNTGEGV